MALGVGLAVGFLPPFATVAVIMGVAVAILLMRNPVYGTYALVLSVPVQKAVSFNAGPIEVTVTQMLFVVVLGVWWGWMCIRQGKLHMTPVAVALVFFLVSTLASLWVATSMSESLAEISRWVVTILAYIIAVNTVQTRREMNILIGVMIFAGLLEALIGLSQAYTGIGPASFNVGGLLTRAYGTIGAPNSFAGYINLSLPLAMALAIYWAGRWFSDRKAAHPLDRLDHISFRRLLVPGLMAVVALILFWTMLTTLSRGAWVALAAGVLVMVFALGKRATATIVTIIVGAASLVGLSAAGALPTPVSERFDLLLNQISIFDPRGLVPTPDNFALIERMVHWQVAGNMFLSSPWVGVGIGNFNPLFTTFGVQGWPYTRGHAHNYYLHLLAEVGIVGLTFYALMLATALLVGIRALRRARRIGDIYGEVVAIGALGILVTFMVHNVFENLHALNMGIHWGAALALFTLVGRDVRRDVQGSKFKVQR